jgi:hypothetical protein
MVFALIVSLWDRVLIALLQSLGKYWQGIRVQWHLLLVITRLPCAKQRKPIKAKEDMRINEKQDNEKQPLSEI